MTTGQPRVVIVGAGFGGLKAAQTLGQLGAEVLLIDRHNYHTFVPLLYQVATAQLEPERVAYPIRTLLRRHPNVRFLMAEVERVDFPHRWVKTQDMTIPYDYLILATGSQPQYLDIDGAKDYTFPLTTLSDAIALRQHILSCFEQATHEINTNRYNQLLTFAIVGGGATGVELAGALSELLHGAIAKDYSTVSIRQVRIVLVQASDRLLPDFPESLGRYTTKRLRRLGVKVYLNAPVQQVHSDGVVLSDNRWIRAATVVWTAGVEATSPPAEPAPPAAHRSKLMVLPTLQLADWQRVYAIGDLAEVQQAKPLAGVAPVALQQGTTAAQNIARQMSGKSPQPFRYFDKERLAIIGHYAGIGKIGPVSLSGFLGWFLWLAVHLVYLPGLHNRLLVLLTWLYCYLRGDRPVRLVSAAAHASRFSSAARSQLLETSSKNPSRSIGL